MGNKTLDLFQNQPDAYSLSAPLQLVLDTRVLRLPPTWLFRGLARAGYSHAELSYWLRHWGQQGVHLSLSTSPLRAPQAVAIPRRSQGEPIFDIPQILS